MENGVFKPHWGNLIIWSIIIISLYIISLKNYLLFHILVVFFSVLISYVVFLIIWRSKGFISNKYLILIGVAYFFIGSYDFLQVLSFPELGMFPGFGLNLSTQFWTIGRYLESTSLFIAPLFLIKHTRIKTNHSMDVRTNVFARNLFFIYALITLYLLSSVMYLKNFPMCYIEGSGFTSFKIISGYLICFIFLCSLVFLYRIKNRFKTHVYKLLFISILLTLLGDGPFLIYSQVNYFLSTLSSFFNILSLYYLYLGIAKE